MFYTVAIMFLKLVYAIIYRIKIEGAENVPADGGFVLCSNHSNAHDPVLLAVSVKRDLYFMAKKELFDNKPLGLLISWLHAFPVDRNASADMKSFKKAVKLLSENNALLIYVQGTRMREIDITQGKSGSAFFALKSGTGILPVGITSSYKLFSPVTIKFGKMLDLSEYKNSRINSETLDAITTKVMTDIKALTV